MRFINPVYLLSKNSSDTNEIGDIITSTLKRKVYAHVDSIKQSEFYQAQALGIKPELSLVVRNFEYKGEVLIEYNSKEYRVIRTYNKGDGNLEIVCVGAVNNGNP